MDKKVLDKVIYSYVVFWYTETEKCLNINYTEFNYLQVNLKVLVLTSSVVLRVEMVM